MHGMLFAHFQSINVTLLTTHQSSCDWRLHFSDTYSFPSSIPCPHSTTFENGPFSSIEFLAFWMWKPFQPYLVLSIIEIMLVQKWSTCLLLCIYGLFIFFHSPSLLPNSLNTFMKLSNPLASSMKSGANLPIVQIRTKNSIQETPGTLDSLPSSSSSHIDGGSGWNFSSACKRSSLFGLLLPPFSSPFNGNILRFSSFAFSFRSIVGFIFDVNSKCVSNITTSSHTIQAQHCRASSRQVFSVGNISKECHSRLKMPPFLQTFFSTFKLISPCASPALESES